MNRSPRFVIGAVTFAAAIAIASVAVAQTTNEPLHTRPSAPPSGVAAPAPIRPIPSNAYSVVPGKKTAAGEQFFIVASLDLQKSQLLLKYPTEVTLLAKTTDQTKFVDDSGNAIKLSDLRTGDTVWVTSNGSADSTVALKVRKGRMTVDDLHRYYLDYPAIK